MATSLQQGTFWGKDIDGFVTSMLKFIFRILRCTMMQDDYLLILFYFFTTEALLFTKSMCLVMIISTIRHTNAKPRPTAMA